MVFLTKPKNTKTKNNKNKKARVPLAGQNTMLSFFFFLFYMTNIDCMNIEFEAAPGAAVVHKGWDFICGIRVGQINIFFFISNTSQISKHVYRKRDKTRCYFFIFFLLYDEEHLV